MPDDKELMWERVSSEQGPDLGLLRVRYDWMRHPSGRRTLKRLVLESVDWVNCVALTPSGHSVMVEQFRFGIGACTLETPGGMVDAGETPLEAAQRELREETGYGGGSWRSLGAVEPNPAIHGHLCHHFHGTNVSGERQRHGTIVPWSTSGAGPQAKPKGIGCGASPRHRGRARRRARPRCRRGHRGAIDDARRGQGGSGGRAVASCPGAVRAEPRI